MPRIVKLSYFPLTRFEKLPRTGNYEKARRLELLHSYSKRYMQPDNPSEPMLFYSEVDNLNRLEPNLRLSEGGVQHPVKRK